ncbi:MAG: hypothetical protein WCV70_01510 [Patescibacteria group bacterium]|jgi:hypothetical protein
MQGVEKSHCNAAIRAVLAAARALWQSTVEEALRPILKYGKSDTLGMDAMPEITIIETLRDYDRFSVVITEEIGESEKGKLKNYNDYNDHRRFRTLFISDPTDRSAQIKESLEKEEDRSRTVLSVIKDPQFQEKWEKNFGKPVWVTGGSSAITCVRRGIPIFSVIVNYINRQLFLACSAGCYVIDLPDDMSEINLDKILITGEKIFFSDTSSHGQMKRFATFMGKRGYEENFIESGFMDENDIKENLFYKFPGGPSRVLYLSISQSKDLPIGFVLANGEKITEWIHWLPYVRFARKEYDQGEPALRLFEIYQDRPCTKEGILMSTPPAYSIFKPVDNDGRMVINVGQFSSFQDPSQIRSTLILAPADNQWTNRVVNQYGFRPIEFFSE